MYKKILLSLAILLCLACTPTTSNYTLVKENYNLDFETYTEGAPLPSQWFQWGSYVLKTEQEDVHGGSYAVSINSGEGTGGFGSVATMIRKQFEGSKITLEGYMRTENVADGHAGLLLRLDSNSGSVGFSNMRNEAITGTNDWKKYSITLDYPERVTAIAVGGILVGSGKAWFDDFRLTIDGTDVSELEEYKAPPVPAELDKEFNGDSKFTLDKATAQQEEDLYKLAKVWGFLKYHHPTIRAGKVNWDFELFRLLPKLKDGYLEVSLQEWLAKHDDFETGETFPAQREIKRSPPLDWLNQSGFLSKELQSSIADVRKAKLDEDSYYVSLSTGIKNPDFSNERPYPSMQFSDTGYRLLALFRYWNMIEYYFPYKHLIERDWDEVLREYIPRMIAANDEKSYKLTTLKLIGEIHDTHANIWQMDPVLAAYFGKNNFSADLKFIDDQLVVTEPWGELEDHPDLRPGTIIKKIDGRDIAERVKELMPVSPASNRPTKLRNIARKIIRTNAKTITLEIDGPTGEKEVTLKTVPQGNRNPVYRTKASHRMLEGNIGYLYPGTLKAGEIDEIMKKFMDTKGLVVDLRCYPSDFIVFSLGKYLVSEPTDFVKFTIGSLTQPGQFSFIDPIRIGTATAPLYQGKVTILIDESTQSQAEYTTMALRQAPGAVVIGSTTAGADGDVSRILLPGNINTMISGIGVYTPEGKETQRIGIVPDINLRPTVAGLRAGRDELLERAIEIIEK